MILIEKYGVDLLNGRASDSGSTGCEFNPGCFYSLCSGFGKQQLLTTNVHPLDTEVKGHLAKESCYFDAPGIIFVAGMDVSGCKSDHVLKSSREVKF